MRSYFDEATDKRLLEAQTEEEVKAIIAETPEAENLADKTDLVMKEIKRLKGTLDEELDLDELDSAAGGAKRKDIYLSETTSCMATFFLEDQFKKLYCYSNDHCGGSNEYKYHHTKYSNCKKGGRHQWQRDTKSEEYNTGAGMSQKRETAVYEGYRCMKCGIFMTDIGMGDDRFEC